jgi:hypothetical protein
VSPARPAESQRSPADDALSEFDPEPGPGYPPEQLPERLVARFVAGPAFPAVVGRTDSTWAIGVEGSPPAKVTPGFGVLVLDPAGVAQGVLVTKGIRGARASIAGHHRRSTTVLLLGIQVANEVRGSASRTPDSVLR